MCVFYVFVIIVRSPLQPIWEVAKIERGPSQTCLLSVEMSSVHSGVKNAEKCRTQLRVCLYGDDRATRRGELLSNCDCLHDAAWQLALASSWQKEAGYHIDEMNILPCINTLPG